MAISPSKTEELLVEHDNYVLTLTLNRPERLNAITTEMLTELSEKMAEANRDPDVRCIILTGAGRGFCCRSCRPPPFIELPGGYDHDGCGHRKPLKCVAVIRHRPALRGLPVTQIAARVVRIEQQHIR